MCRVPPRHAVDAKRCTRNDITSTTSYAGGGRAARGYWRALSDATNSAINTTFGKWHGGNSIWR